MAAYIDLNPVRAGMVDKPEDYKWCSYGEAIRPKNNTRARAGICRVMRKNKAVQQHRDDADVVMPDWSNGIAEKYRVLLFADGEEAFAEQAHSGETKRVRKGFKRKQVKRVLAKGGKLTLGETLRCKVRYFTDGTVFGSKDFIETTFSKTREWFSPDRKTGARPLSGVGWRKKQTRLYSMRQLGKKRIE